MLIKENFYSYAFVIALITFTSIFLEVTSSLNNYQELKDVASYKCLIVVVRENKEQIISSDELVPGDLVIIPQNCTLPCDIVLMSGQCVVNESILTGESFPVIKTTL